MKKTSILLLFLSFTISLAAQDPRLVVPIGHTDAIESVAFSPDGKQVLTGSRDKTAKLWDLSGRELQTFAGHAGEVISAVFSPDGKQVLTGSWDKTAKLWDLQGRELQTFAGHTVEITSVAFSPDGKLVLTGSGRDAKLWDLSGRELKTFAGHAKTVTSVAFSLDGKQVLTGSGDKTAKLWDLQGRELQTFAGHAKTVYSVSFSPDGKQVLTGSEDDTAKLWDLSGRELQTFAGDTAIVSSVAFSPDGKQVLTGSWNGVAKLWDLSGRELQAFVGHKYIIKSVAFSPDGKQVLTGSWDETAKLWDLSGRELQAFGGHVKTVASVAFSPDGKLVLTGSGRDAKLWDLSGRELQTFAGHAKIVASLAFSLDGKQVLTGSWDKTAKLWDLSGRELKTFAGHAKTVTSVAFSPDGKQVLTGSGDETAKLWDLSGREIQTFTGHTSAVYPVSFSPDGKQVLTGSEDKRARLWDLQGRELQTFAGHAFVVISVAFSPDGKSVLTGSLDGTAKLWDLSGRELQAFVGHTHYLNSVAFSPDGKHVLTGSWDETAKLWDLSGREIQTFRGHSGSINSVSFSPDGKQVLTGSADNTAKLWDAVSGQELATLIALDSSDWVVTTPSGLFDASSGAMNLMYFLQGLEVIDLEQLKDRYYEPGLLAKVLGFALGGLRPVGELNEVKLYPAIQSAIIEGDRLTVRLEERSGGIGQVMLLLDDQITLEQNINPGFTKDFEVDLSRFAGYFLPEAINRLSLRTYNREGWLKSGPFVIEYRPTGVRERGNNTELVSLNQRKDAQLDSIHLYALIVGTSNYSGVHLNLKYPDKDAIAMAEALQKTGEKLFRNNIEITLLTTSADPFPRKAEIAGALKKIAAKAGPEDILLVYLSGHGITYPPNSEKGRFYYLTTDIKGDKLDDPAILNSQAVSQDSLQEWIRKVPARKRILILDACNSGQVVETLLVGEKSLNSDQRRALERMKDYSGMFVLAGSAADKSSYEASSFDHGLLTYSLLKNMPQVAAANKTLIDIGELFNSAVEEVPRLAKDINRVQKPELIGAESYAIGIIDGDSPYKIPKALPVFLRTGLTEKEKFKDIQLLGKATNRYLEKRAMEKSPQLAFWDVGEFAGDHYLIVGEYEMIGANLEGKAKLYRKNQELTTIPFSGPAASLDKLAEEIVIKAFNFIHKK